MKRRLLWLSGMVLAMAVGGSFLLFFINQHDPVNESNCERIQGRMSEEEVEKILTRPGKPWKEEVNVKLWEGSKGSIILVFDPQKKVQSKMWCAPTSPSLFRRILYLFGLETPPMSGMWDYSTPRFIDPADLQLNQLADPLLPPAPPPAPSR